MLKGASEVRHMFQSPELWYRCNSLSQKSFCTHFFLFKGFGNLLDKIRIIKNNVLHTWRYCRVWNVELLPRFVMKYCFRILRRWWYNNIIVPKWSRYPVINCWLSCKLRWIQAQLAVLFVYQNQELYTGIYSSAISKRQRHGLYENTNYEIEQDQDSEWHNSEQKAL